MKSMAIVDTGPLVAALVATDCHHAWTVEQLKRFRGPLITCEAVLSETFFLLRAIPQAAEKFWGMIDSGGVEIAFALGQESRAVSRLMLKYADIPMSFADACLVRMSELFPKHGIFTTDSDFKSYRRHRNKPLPLVVPA